MKRWKLKGCPRCQKGDLYIEKDILGNWTEICLQCGYEKLIKTAENITVKDNKDDRQSRLLLA